MSRNRNHAIPAGYWPAPQAYVLATVTLLIGIAAGYLLRGSEAQNVALPPAGAVAASTAASVPGAGSVPSTEAMIQPLLRQLQSRPNDAALLVQIGNTYYDGRQYQQAVEYYRRVLKARPEDVNVRTDMGTAMWYTGDADGALQQFEQSLKYQSNHAQTLFNMGIVKWQGKNDIKGALQAWERLLASNPNYSDRQKVVDLMQKLRSGAGS